MPDKIVICICTYKRPNLLKLLLNNIKALETNGLFTYSIVLVDNDRDQSGRSIYLNFKNNKIFDIKYFVEPIQNIALARNMAVSNANGQYVAFIDDDEYPCREWLLKQYKLCIEKNADGVLGPVIPYYEIEPPVWIKKGKFFERPNPSNGTILTWDQTRTGNALIKRYVFKEDLFDQMYGSGGEDREYFKKMINKGYKFIWCNDSFVYEYVSKERMKKLFMLKRAILRGKVAAIQNNNIATDIIKSFIAIFIYTLILPLLLIGSKHLFMRYSIKCFDHIGKILGYLKIELIKEKYIVG